jgi:RNA polymerase sigma-70 factor (ECF subfamily)
VSESDRAAVRAVRRGDREAYAGLVHAYQHRLFGLVLMIVRRRDAADELTQDAFVRAYTHLAVYDDRREFYPWLATIAVRLAQSWLRRHARDTKREGTSLDDAREPATNDAPLTDLLADERDRALWRSVAALSCGERTVVLLYYRDGLGVRDIAGALGVTDGTVKTLLFRARAHLRERLVDVTPFAGTRS